MKLGNVILLVIVLVALSVAAYSVAKMTSVQVTEEISLAKVEDCETIYWEELENIYGTCVAYHNQTVCDDEPLNTSCSVQVIGIDYPCKTGTTVLNKNKEVCADKALEITVDNVLQQEKYRLGYDQWGKCSYTTEGSELVVTCDSQYDGNGDGICTSGESCIQFRITKDGTQRLVKNSRDEFIERDSTFFLEKLSLEEVRE